MSATAGEPESFSRSTIVATVLMVVGPGCINAIQPLLLGALYDAGRISVTQIGHSATAELGGMAVATTVAALIIPTNALRRWAAGALLMMLAANCLTPLLSGGAVIACRMLNGLGTGLLVWVLIGLVGRVAAPGRLYGIYLTAQAIGSLIFSVALSSAILPYLGLWGAYGLLALLDLLMLIAALPFIAPRYAVRSAQQAGLPPLPGLMGLIGVGCMMGGIMALWVYALPLFRALGHGETAARVAISTAIAGQIAGGALSSLMAGRMRPLVACIAGAGICALCILIILILRSDAVLIVTMGLFAICWMGVPSFHVPLLIGLDPSLRAVLLIGSAQMLGLSLAPLIAAAAIDDHGILATTWVAITFILLSVVSLTVATAVRRHPRIGGST